MGFNQLYMPHIVKHVYLSHNQRDILFKINSQYYFINNNNESIELKQTYGQKDSQFFLDHNNINKILDLVNESYDIKKISLESENNNFFLSLLEKIIQMKTKFEIFSTDIRNMKEQYKDSNIQIIIDKVLFKIIVKFKNVSEDKIKDLNNYISTNRGAFFDCIKGSNFVHESIFSVGEEFSTDGNKKIFRLEFDCWYRISNGIGKTRKEDIILFHDLDMIIEKINICNCFLK